MMAQKFVLTSGPRVDDRERVGLGGRREEAGEGKGEVVIWSFRRRRRREKKGRDARDGALRGESGRAN
jgi:hypothetical protein